MKRFRTYAVILGFGAVLLMPWGLKKVSGRFGLSGVTVQTQFPVLTRAGLMDGSVQEDIGEYFSQHLPGRDLMIKVRNQMIFSLFQKSPNENIVIGENDNLYEKEYVLKYEKVYEPVSEEYARQLCDQLTAIQEKVEAAGKEMYVFITPTKVRYYEEDVPQRYRASAVYPDSPGNYEMFTEVLKDYDLKVYDSIPYADEFERTQPYPLYYKTGSHWSWPLSKSVTADFAAFLDENSRFDFAQGTVEVKPSPVPIFPDTDIFDSLNLFTKPYDTYYEAQYICEQGDGPKPNLFCRGGSFMGQTIASMIRDGYFDHDMYVENTVYYQDHFTSGGSFSDYGELNLAQAIGQADIVIFEVNEAHVPVMGFGLYDYLLEHPEIFEQTGGDE